MAIRSVDHPEANGRKPNFGEQQWVLIIPFGDNLVLKLGKISFDKVRQMVVKYTRWKLMT